MGPRGHLVISKLDLFVDLFSLLALLLRNLDSLVELRQLGSELGLAGRIDLVLLFILVVVHLQLLQLLSPVLVVLPQLVDFGLVLGN